jgi:hypothetical protein
VRLHWLVRVRARASGLGLAYLFACICMLTCQATGDPALAHASHREGGAQRPALAQASHREGGAQRPPPLHNRTTAYNGPMAGGAATRYCWCRYALGLLAFTIRSSVGPGGGKAGPPAQRGCAYRWTHSFLVEAQLSTRRSGRYTLDGRSAFGEPLAILQRQPFS